MATNNTRQVSLQEANTQYRKEEAARHQADVSDQTRIKCAIETAFGKSTVKPRRGAPAGSRKKVQS